MSTTEKTPRTDPSASSGMRPPGLWRRWLGYTLALLGLLWVVHDIRPDQALKDLAAVRWNWLCLALPVNLFGFIVQAIRWRLLLLVLGDARFTQCVRAIFSGLFASAVLPLRAGEVFRAWLISKETSIRLASVLTSIGVERMLDGVVLASAIAIISFYADLPAEFQSAGRAFGMAVLILLLLFLAGALYLNLVPSLAPGAHPLRVKIRRKFAPILDAVRLLGAARNFYVAAVVAVGIPVCQILGLWAFARAYGISLSLAQAAVVLCIINFGVALPMAPSNIGAYQFFCVLGLSIFGVEKTQAAGFSILVHVLLSVSQSLLGFLAMVRSGLSVTDVKQRMARLASSDSPGASSSPRR